MIDQNFAEHPEQLPPSSEPLPPAQQLDPAVLKQIREGLVLKFQNMYHEFIKSLMPLPAHPACKDRACKYMDDAYLWMKEGLLNAEINQSQVVIQNPQPQAPESTMPAQEAPQTSETPTQ